MLAKVFFLCIAIVFSQMVWAQDADSTWVLQNYSKQEVMVPMRDGKKLFTTIYAPKNLSGKFPILLKRTPYSCAPYGKDKFAASLYNSYHINYLKQGYIMVVQDVRGRWMSEGDFVDIRPFNPNKKGKEFDEASDTYDAIEWLINNIPNTNKRVGVFGISYPGFYSTMAALSGHPALKAVSPQAPVTDWFKGDDFHHNGAFMLLDAFNFYSGFGKPRPVPTTVASSGYQFASKDNYNAYLQVGALNNFTKLMGDSIAFWKDLMNHPNYDTWWKARDPQEHVQLIKPAILVVGGLFDAEDCYGAWSLYKSIETKNKNVDNRIVMGPWFHGAWGGRSNGTYLGNVRFESATSEYYHKFFEIPFFNFYLKLEGTVSQIAEANIFFTGSNDWKQFKEWPLKETKPLTLYLTQKNGISFNSPTSSATASEYLSDPNHPVPYTEDVHQSRTREYMTDDQRFASRRPDVLTFSSDVLTTDITCAGPVLANLFASISTTDADFVVKIIDVFPDDFKYETSIEGNGKNYPMGGYQMLVRGEVMRGKFRNSFEKPEAFIPNQITKVNYALPDIAHTFKKGHRIMVQIQSTWFPLVDRNPQVFTNINTCTDADFKKSLIKIHHEAKNASSIVLQTIDKY